MPSTAVTARNATPGDAASRVDLPIQGMTCASCVARVERALKAVPGLEEAHVNLVTGRASVTFDPSTATRAALTRAVEDAGYEVPQAAAASTTSVELPIAGMTCASCVRRLAGARQAIASLRDMGIAVAMVTGDRRSAAEAIAAELGIGADELAAPAALRRGLTRGSKVGWRV